MKGIYYLIYSMQTVQIFGIHLFYRYYSQHSIFQVVYHIALKMKEKNTTKSLKITLHDEHRQQWQLHADVPLYNRGGANAQDHTFHTGCETQNILYMHKLSIQWTTL